MGSFLILIYRRVLSPFFQVVFQIQCRFEESCSHYTQRMVRENGIFKGLYFGLIRFCRCNPWVNGD